RSEPRPRGIELLLALVELLFRRIALGQEEVGAVELLLRENRQTCLLHHIGARLIERTLPLQHLGLCLTLLRLEILCVHASEHLPRRDAIALIGANLRDSPRELRRDIDFVGFEPAIARGKARRQAERAMEPPIGTDSGRGQQRERHGKDELPRPAAPCGLGGGEGNRQLALRPRTRWLFRQLRPLALARLDIHESPIRPAAGSRRTGSRPSRTRPPY